MTTPLKHEYERHVGAGYTALAAREFDSALVHFEAAHILGQAHTGRHVRSHLALFRWAWARSDRRELSGQVGRMIGAALFTWWWVPRGNPGTTRVSAFAPHPIPDELRSLIETPK